MQQTSLHRTVLELVASCGLVDIADGGFEIEYILLMQSPAPLRSATCHTDDGGGLPPMSSAAWAGLQGYPNVEDTQTIGRDK